MIIMLKLTVSHDFAGGAGQALAPQALIDELRLLSGLNVAEEAEKLLSLLIRLEDRPMSLADRQAGLRILNDACCVLQRRGDAAGGSHGAALRRLWRRLHEDCKLLARAGSGQSFGLFGNSKPQQEALALAMSSGWHLLRVHTLSYAPLFAGFWLDCHQLFAEVRGRGWEHRAPGGDQVALGAWYRRLLLLGMSSSNRLDPLRQRLLLDWTGEHGQALRLEALARRPDEVPCWLVMADADSPGRFADSQADAGGLGWLADASPVLDRLRERARGRQRQMTAAEWQMLARLEVEWRSPPQRKHHRLNQRNGQRVMLLAGFECCWRLARAGSPPDDAEPAQLLLANLSASGMRLCGDFGRQAVQAGAIVMFKRHGFGWQLGLVRWISLPGGAEPAECGVEFVGKRPLAVEAAAQTSHPDGVMEKGLLLYGERQFRQRGVLVLAGRQYQALRQFTLRGDDGGWLVRAQRLLQQTSLCQIMDVRLVEAAESAGSAASS
ncbi:hypothetical protein BI347_12385 [Chromobacterium sphagni]|uniref:PilZ domain-containing protein n=2 Tax=Chromobacterium sphagni TaxID=1903179 RepID=A0A1S1X400_9NEIS|nr:hypothetical protein BI347_12385 [Chromobacterium sphagni]